MKCRGAEQLEPGPEPQETTESKMQQDIKVSFSCEARLELAAAMVEARVLELSAPFMQQMAIIDAKMQQMQQKVEDRITEIIQLTISVAEQLAAHHADQQLPEYGQKSRFFFFKKQ